MSGKTFYTDTKGSQVNDAAQKENEAKQKPIADFLHYELESLDGTPSWSHIQGLSAPCANTLLESWAKAGALSATRDENGNYSSQGGIDRQVLIRSFIFVGLKLQSKGFELGPNVIPWLRKLVQHNNENWRKISLRSNLYYWAGSIAANFALLSHDQDSLNFQNEVWKYAMSAIRDDGVLDSEATRGTRALVYHQYALSALLTLREARRALGLRAIDVEQRKLRVLADRVGTALCHPETMAGIASEKTQELPGEWGYREV
ncbi:MAG: alginate lyase family protein, partial [Methylocella sp.]